MKRNLFSLFILFLMLVPGSCLAFGKAYNPWPEDGSHNVSLYTDLSWDYDGESCSLYFGRDPDRLSQMTDGSISSRYDIDGRLMTDEKYYWRVDVHQGGDTAKGDLWTFRTRDSSLIISAGCDIGDCGNLIILSLLPLLQLIFGKKRG